MLAESLNLDQNAQFELTPLKISCNSEPPCETIKFSNTLAQREKTQSESNQTQCDAKQMSQSAYETDTFILASHNETILSEKSPKRLSKCRVDNSKSIAMASDHKAQFIDNDQAQ